MLFAFQLGLVYDLHGVLVAGIAVLACLHHCKVAVSQCPTYVVFFFDLLNL